MVRVDKCGVGCPLLGVVEAGVRHRLEVERKRFAERRPQTLFPDELFRLFAELFRGLLRRGGEAFHPLRLVACDQHTALAIAQADGHKTVFNRVKFSRNRFEHRVLDSRRRDAETAAFPVLIEEQIAVQLPVRGPLAEGKHFDVGHRFLLIRFEHCGVRPDVALFQQRVENRSERIVADVGVEEPQFPLAEPLSKNGRSTVQRAAHLPAGSGGNLPFERGGDIEFRNPAVHLPLRSAPEIDQGIGKGDSVFA